MNKALPTPVRQTEVLTTALLRSADLLGLRKALVSRVIGVSESTLSRLQNGSGGIKPDSKEGQLAVLLIRLFRSLDALVGNDAELRLAWMRSHNTALNGVPQQLIERPDGLVLTLQYLDAMRATC